MIDYIAAGFDPARFWRLSPRLYVLEMEGAAERAALRRREIWLTAMLPHMKKPPTLAEFVNVRRDRRSDMRACIAAWDKVDAALNAFNSGRGASL